MSEHHCVMKAACTGEAKAREASVDPGRYALRSVMAGLYLSLVVMVFWALTEGLASSPAGKVIASGFFGVGLCVIVFTQSELFTSNCFYLSVSTLTGRTSWWQAARVLVMSWLGNLAGALLLAVSLHQAGVFAGLSPDHALFSGALHKAEQAAPVLFWKGILANWVVCLAVWVALRLKEEVAKILAMILVVFTFLYLGFEHSIANMGTFSFAIAGGGDLTVAGALRNLAYATLGNLLGGGLLVGAAYVLLARPSAEEPEAAPSPVASTAPAE